MMRTHYKSLSLVSSIFVGIVLALTLTVLVSYLVETTTTPQNETSALPVERAAIPPSKQAQVPQNEAPASQQNETSALPVERAAIPPSQQAQVPQNENPASQQKADKLIEPFFVRAEGSRGPLIAYEMTSGQEQFRLPAGMPSADWKHYYAATLQQDKTLLEVFEPQSGQHQRNFALAGQWNLSGVSPSGRWLVLTRLPASAEGAGRQTDIQIVDANSGQVTHKVQFEGNFEVETISAGGDSLFLIEHLPAVNPTQYLIRLYDVAAAQLLPDALRSKTATEEEMTGLAWGGLASPDGQWLLTLYLNTRRDVAFIHTLSLENKFPFCIDLPSGKGELDKLKAYSLALSPDGRTVYAANAALGVVAEVSLESLNVTRQAKFPAVASPETGSNPETGPTNYSVVSKDGRRLYFTSGWDVWSYDTLSGEVEGPHWSGSSIQGLALSQDERQLYLAVEGKSPLVIELEESVVVNLSSKD